MHTDMTEEKARKYRDLTGHFPSPLFPDHFIADDGKVFVEIDDFDFREVLETEADPEKIIKCLKCEKPAKRLDHLWPYHGEFNACVEHLKGSNGPASLGSYAVIKK